MNTHRNDDELLRRWIDEGIDVAPPRAVEAALWRISTTRQRRELALLRRIGLMDLAGQRRGPATWRLALGALVAVGVVAISVAAAVVVVPRLWNQPSVGLASGAVDRVIAAAASAQPPGTVRRAEGPGPEAIIPFLIDSQGSVEIRSIEGVAASAAIGYQGSDDTRRYLVAAIVFDAEASAASGFTTIANAFEASATPTWIPGSWYAGPDSAIAGRGTEARLFLGPNAVATSGTPGAAQIWRTGRAVIVVIGVAGEAGLAGQVSSEVDLVADAMQPEVDRLMR
jgi:hypothetical protein